MPVRLDRSSANFAQRFAQFLAAKREVSADVEKATRAIVDDVAARGDAALLEATKKFDRLDIDAATALSWGLINRVVATEKLDDEVQRFVDRILARSGAAIALGKGTFYSQIESGLTGAYCVAGAAMTSNMQFDDATEGIDAFLTKRPPHWRNE